MKHTSRRKSAKRRCKRLVAALAGAAVVTSAMLPGLPLSHARAAENTAITAPSPDTEANPPTEEIQDNSKDTTQENTVTHDRDKERPGEQQSSPITVVKAAAAAYGFDARHDSFSLQWHSSTEAVVIVRTDRGKTFKIRLSKTADDWKINSVTEVVTGGHDDGVIHLGDPVAVVKDNAATFGFDAYDDSFTLLSNAGGKAIVQVKTSGQTFKVDLERSGTKWIITTIRGIGNSKYPATYRPASLYGYRTLGAATAPVTTVTKKTLYSSNSFTNWTWHESVYPADMKVGVLLSKPESADIADIPGIIVDKVEAINFDRQLVLYAHIGSVAGKGYGIGIEKVVQTGNNLTVTIRTKSPLENQRLSPTINNEVIALDRLTLNFDNPIHIQFIDQKGAILSNYTLYKK